MADPDPGKRSATVLPERFSAPTPVAPDEATWRAMTPAQRRAAIEEILEAMPIEELMSEGTRHFNAKVAVAQGLDRFFRRSNRGVFIASELTVCYPGEHTFVPDVIAICDVELKDRTAWVVLEEGRGPDFVLEVRNLGHKAKDYRRNVEWFARLGIPEYFLYEVQSHELAGYRLEDPQSRRYVPVVPQAGRYASRVLGLDLAVVDATLRFFFAGAQLPDPDAELQWLTQTVADREARLEEEYRRAQAETERAQAEAARAQAEAARADAALASLREAVRSILAARGLALDPAQSARLDAESDAERLRDLAIRAATAAAAEGLLPA